MKPEMKRSFQQNEKLVLRVGLGIFATTLLLFGIMLLLLRTTNLDPEVFSIIVLVLLFGSITLFLATFVRIVMYLAKVRLEDKTATIGRSIGSLFLSLISFFIQYLLLIVIALSNWN
ncbi:MAG: hypothetical protein KJ847_00135 [Firmicutes bacterium]|nr:hypothetical protein [Bacillota bacterium]